MRSHSSEDLKKDLGPVTRFRVIFLFRFFFGFFEYRKTPYLRKSNFLILTFSGVPNNACLFFKNDKYPIDPGHKCKI